MKILIRESVQRVTCLFPLSVSEGTVDGERKANGYFVFSKVLSWPYQALPS